MAVITKQELEDAQVDAQTLEDVVNGAADLNGDGTLTSRLGTALKTLKKIIDDLATEDIGASAAAQINQALNEFKVTTTSFILGFDNEIFENFSESAGSFQYDSSTFSGWSVNYGVVAAFQSFRCRIQEHSSSTPTSVRFIIREDTHDGTILFDETVPWGNRDSGGYFNILLPSVIDTSAEIVFQWQADDLATAWGSGSGGVDSRYTTGGNQAGTFGGPATAMRTWILFQDVEKTASYFEGLINAIEASVNSILKVLNVVNGELFTESGSTDILNTSTFSGFSTWLGVVSDPFSNVKFVAKPHSSSTPSNIKVTIREDTYDGTILAQKTIQWSERDANGYITCFFDDVIDSAENLIFQTQADDLMSLYGKAGSAISAPADSTRYSTSGNQSDTGAWADSSAEYVQWVEFGKTLDTVGSLDSRLTTLENADSNFVPRVNLADKYYAVQGEVMQLFKRGIVEAIDPYQYEMVITGAELGSDNLYDEAEIFPRYIEIQPDNAATRSLKVEVYNNNNTKLVEDTAVVEVVNPIAGPASNKNILCLGDSLTANSIYVTELNRRLTGSGGDPVAKNYSNLTFIGSQGSGANKHEGRSGWSWGTFSTAGTSPLYNGGVLDWDHYITNTLSDTTVDQVYFFLTWNGWTDALKVEASDWQAEIDLAKAIIDGLNTDFPSCKVTLMGVQVPCPLGGLGDTYGDGGGPYGKYWQMAQSVFGLNLAYKSIADDVAYSSFVDFMDIATQLDSEYNMPTIDKQVNTRNTLTERIGNNGIHPSTAGYHQVADAVYRHVMGVWCV